MSSFHSTQMYANIRLNNLSSNLLNSNPNEKVLEEFYPEMMLKYNPIVSDPLKAADSENYLIQREIESLLKKTEQ